MFVVVDQATINLVNSYYEIVFDGQSGNGFKLGLGHHGPRWIVGIAEQNHLGAWSNSRGDLGGSHTEIILRVGWHWYRNTASEHNVGLVSHIARIGRDYLVAGINQCAHRQVYAFAYAYCHQQLVRGIVGQAITTVEHGGDCFAQFDHAIIRSILSMTEFYRADASLADVFRCDETGFSYAERDHIWH